MRSSGLIGVFVLLFHFNVSAQTLQPPRDEVIQASLSLLKNKDLKSRKRACQQILSPQSTDVVFAKHLVTVRNLVRSDYDDVSECMVFRLLSAPKNYRYSFSDLGAMENAANSPHPKTHGYGIRGMAAAGASFEQIAQLVRNDDPNKTVFYATNLAEALVDTASTIDVLLSRLGHPKLADSTVYQAVAAFPKEKGITEDTAGLRKARRALLASFKNANRSMTRVMLVTAITSLYPTPKELMALLEITEGYFEHLTIFQNMKRHWGPKQTWAVPRILEELNRPDPLVFEIVAALEAINPTDFHGLIGWSLARFMDHEKYGVRVRFYLPKLEIGPSYASKILKGNGRGKGRALDTQKKQKSCNLGFLERVRHTKFEDHHLTLAAYDYRHSCGDDMTEEILELIDAWPGLPQFRSKALSIISNNRNDEVLKRLDSIPIDPKLVDADTILGWVLAQTYPIDAALDFVTVSQAEKFFVQGFTDGDAKQKEVSLLALGALPQWNQTTTQTAIDALSDDATSVRRAAALSMAFQKRTIEQLEPVLDTLNQLSRNNDRDASIAALMALANLAPNSPQAQLAVKDFPLEKRLAQKFDPGMPYSACVISPAPSKRRLLAFRKTSVALSARALAVCPQVEPRELKPFEALLKQPQPRPAITMLFFRHGDVGQIRKALSYD